MEQISKTEIQVEKFNQIAKVWNKNIPEKNYEVAIKLIKGLQICKGNSVLDVACGTGILFSILKDKGLSKYIGVDISYRMIEEFLNIYPDTNVRKVNFELIIKFEQTFDFIIIYNSIPHFNDLNIVFNNAFNNLHKGGKFIIAHSKTREGLREHHEKIGYISNPPPIPNDEMLLELSSKYKFININIEDIDYFCFSCERA